MAVYDVKVVRPSGVAHVAGARARLSIRLASEARHAGMLVNTDPVVVDLPGTGEAQVSLIPSDQLVSDSGRAALYHVEETWLDPDGVAIPGGYSSWGERFYLRSGGGALADQLIVPPGIPGVYVRSTDPQVYGPVLAGEIWIDLTTGEIKEWDMQTQNGWVPRGHLGAITDQQIAGHIADEGSATAVALSGTIAAVAGDAVAPALQDAQDAVAAATAAATLAQDAAAQSVRAWDAPGQIAVFIGSSNVVPSTWPTQLCTLMGWEQRNYAVGGAGLHEGDPGNQYNWIWQAHQAAAQLGAVADQVGVIFVAGGGNDARNPNQSHDVSPQMGALLDKLMADFPRARVVVIPGLWGAQAVSTEIVLVSESMRRAALDRGCLVIWHAWEWLVGQPSLMADSIHPNAAGYERFVSWIRAGLDGQETAPAGAAAVSWVSGVSNRSGRVSQVTMAGGVVTLEVNALIATGMAGGATLGTIPRSLAPGTAKSLVSMHNPEGSVFVPNGMVMAEPSGSLKWYGPTGVSTFVIGSLSWHVGR